MPCVRCVVTGRVQGVFFRVSARDQARSLGLTGQVRNLPDGGVEVLASGTATAIAAFQRWLREGPPGASVENVSCDSYPDPGSEIFVIT
jgi:acylphosphatase